MSEGQDELDAVRSALLAVRGGKQEAFSIVVECYQRRLFGLATMMLRDPEAAEEVVQDAFVRAFLHLDRYDDRRPFYPWIATIAVRLAQTALRRQARIRELSGGGSSDREPASGGDTLGELIADETGRRLWQAVAALPSGERTAVYLYYRQDMKVSEIASALGVTSGTIKTLLFRARRKLRAKMLDAVGEAEVAAFEEKIR